MSFLAKLNPFRKKRVGPNPQQLAEFAGQWGEAMRKQQRGFYDAARIPDDLTNYWANADNFDADSANSKQVRQKLVRHSRYEMANNGYADGIAQTYSTDLVGTGPTLRMQTSSTGFNQLVESSFYLWCKAVSFRRKLWCMAHAKHGDGEALGVLRINKRINNPIPLDVVLYETEQCQTPFMPFFEPGRIDGIKFDEFGNPIFYDFLKHHPGMANGLHYQMIPEEVPADRVLHWFKMRRPGQHRGVPECASTLNLGAIFRRGRNAQVSTWEKICSWTLFFKSMFEPEVAQAVIPMSTMDVQHNMATMLPNSVEPVQLKAEQPGPTYEAYHKTLLNEQARPKSMPYGRAAADSSDYNFSSAKLDLIVYEASLEVDREDCNDLVLDRVFSVWFDFAVTKFGWLGGNPDAISEAARVHSWDWPKHRIADVESEANANLTKLESGQTFPHLVFAEAGLDFDDEVAKAATSFGVTEQEYRKRLFDVLLPEALKPAAPPHAGTTKQAPASASAAIELRGLPVKVNGNGAHHGN